MNLNKVLLIGRLTHDVDFKYLPSGIALSVLNLATNRFYKDRMGNNKEETEYHRIIVWGKLAEICHKYLNKGRLVFVEGRIRSRSYLDNQGNKKLFYEIIAENIRFGPKASLNDAEKELEELETDLDAYKPEKDNETDIDILDIGY